VPEIGEVFFTKELKLECLDFYAEFYTVEEEEGQMRLWETVEETFLCYDRSMQRIMPWLSKKGVRRTCPHIAGACRSLDCCRGTEAVPASSEEVDPAEMEEQKPSAARLVVGKRKTKKGKQGKWATKWAAM
jgi:hypothetical protein